MAEMNTTFDPETHIGTVNGEEWPSVTQLLSEERLQNLSQVPPDRLEYKRILGTRVHAATGLLDNGSLDEEHFQKNFPECVPYLEAYRKFRLIEKFEPLHKELRLFSKKYRFHGAFDEGGLHSEQYAGNLCIIDYKCVWRMYESTGPQTAGYAILAIENAKELGIQEEFTRRKVLRFGLNLKPTGNYEIVQYKDSNDTQDFLACCWLHWRRREHFHTQKGLTLL